MYRISWYIRRSVRIQTEEEEEGKIVHYGTDANFDFVLLVLR